jgi:Holliday junction resolvase
MGARGRFARFGAVRRKPDANQADIVKALRRCGVSVLDLSSVGGDCPDLLCGYHGVDRLLEVKMPDGKPSDGQADFARDWRGAPVVTVRSEVEALLAIGIVLNI